MSVSTAAVDVSANHRPSDRMPLPASRMTSLPSAHLTSTQGVFPPYRAVSGPGLGMEPRVPQNLRLRLMSAARSLRRRQYHGRAAALYAICHVRAVTPITCEPGPAVRAPL